MFDSTRRTTSTVIAVAVVMQIVASVFCNAVVFQGSVAEFLWNVREATGGLISPNLVANIVPLVFVVGLVFFVVARLAPADVGWERAKLLPALIVLGGLWLGTHFVLLIIAASGEREVLFHPAWTSPGAGFVLGNVLGQIMGNALAEETVFRGFFFPQFYLNFEERLGRVWALVIAALVSQIVFALMHIPNRLLVKGIVGPELIADQVRLIVLGLFFLAIYVVTQNLWLAVGIHALANAPAALVHAPDGTVATVWLSLAFLLVLSWAPLRKLRRYRRH